MHPEILGVRTFTYLLGGMQFYLQQLATRETKRMRASESGEDAYNMPNITVHWRGLCRGRAASAFITGAPEQSWSKNTGPHPHADSLLLPFSKRSMVATPGWDLTEQSADLP